MRVADLCAFPTTCTVEPLVKDTLIKVTLIKDTLTNDTLIKDTLTNDTLIKDTLP